MKKAFLYFLPFCFATALCISCSEILMETDISKKEVLLVAPADHAQFFSTTVAFSWEKVIEASGYRLQIARPNFTNPSQIVLDTLVTSNTYTKQLTIGEYEWRVKAVNSAYETPFKSRFLTVVSNTDFQNNTVVQITPSNNLVTKITVQNLSWQDVIGATSYQVQIYDNTNTIVNDQTVTTTNLTYTFAQGSYQWRVRASNGTDQTLYSARNILVDITAPNTPTLTSPNNASTQTSGPVDFLWNRTPIAGSAEKDSLYIYTNSNLTTLQSKSEATSPFSASLTVGTYYWFVKSFDAAGNASAQSSVFNFTLN